MIEPYSYHLPEEKIAQRPTTERDRAKLLVIDRSTATISDQFFYSLPQTLAAGDMVIFNNTKVVPARIFGKVAGMSRKCEFLLLRKLSEGRWECIAKPLRKLKEQTIVEFSDNLFARVISRKTEKSIEVEFFLIDQQQERLAEDRDLAAVGTIPIPPYIRGGEGDQQDLTDYQTVFAKVAGSVAAPTASLHFTQELLKQLEDKGVLIEYITLHVGPASFLPLDSIDKSMFSEHCYISAESWQRINNCIKEGKRVVAVGTTVCRALEGIASKFEEQPEREYLNKWVEVDLIIKPGYKFKIVNSQITNFHQPGTSHLLLVQALLGRELLDKTYQHALNNGYRFLSYGDGMIIL